MWGHARSLAGQTAMPAGEGCSRGAGVAQMPGLQQGQPNLGTGRARRAAVPLGQAPTPGDAQVSWQRLLTPCEPGIKQQRRNVTTGKITVGILTASTTTAAASLRPGCSAFPNAVLLPRPSADAFHAHPWQLGPPSTTWCRGSSLAQSTSSSASRRDGEGLRK